MDEQTQPQMEQDESRQIYPGLRSYVTTDAEFIALVEKGIASGKRGPNLEMSVVFDEIRKRLLAR